MPNKKPDKDNARDTRLRQSMLKYAAAAVAIIVVVLGVNQLWGLDGGAQFEEKAALLEQKALTQPELELKIGSGGGNIDSRYTVFFSICDTDNRALVQSAQGETLEAAWDKAVQETKRLIASRRYDPVWVKADIVRETEVIKASDIQKRTRNLYDNYLRMGIAFDNSFSTAFLEAEVNGNKIIDYEENTLDLGLINKYLTSQGRPNISTIPEEIILFSCYGYFCDESKSVYELYSDDQDYGRRKVDSINKEVVMDMTYSASRFLANCVKEDGKFVYGYYPTYDNEIDNYNILRHAGTIWSLVSFYKNTGDETMLPKIESTIDYLVNGSIEYPTEDTAYVIERKADEVKLGGNGITVVMLIDYMQQFGTDRFRDLVIKLGNGILAMQNPATGEYYHVLNSQDYSLKDEDRTVYYDGEATFALAKLYGYTKDPKYLEAATKAADYFIANDYAQYRDHWVAYSLNEITKYVPEERYYGFALQNANQNLDTISNKMRSTPTYLELLMATFATYDRIKQDNISVEYMKQFDEKYFIDTIYKRARHQANGYMYPEYAMYLKNPARVLNTFYVRDDGFRIRIDDVQHFIGGYYAYYNNYDKLEAYRQEFARTQ